ncbi:SMC-Scp complex subunit ScpB [Actinoplanes teichomyceticus]|uniref:Segregation and condensation protein B n=1 Tax=Actinoplanes teichomyceticus TaxID=1867 RepID=A0A561WC49_ACTTI|nr:SMC-Scp complex subunit ScpB [Actinoplanes teichomyceticus]TWG21444.1 segregation and condensation protein B [Actinoplanes teichomyceticus]GIF16582.1 hypothetical protein Ate01nite_66140 [Actinoplanes teichomyceticus]
MSSDERPESLAAQMGAWVPPWERKRDEPDRAFQARAEAAGADGGDGPAGPDPAGRSRPAPQAAAAVDAPQEPPADDEPADAEIEPEMPLPEPVEEAAEQAADAPAEPDDAPAPVDAPAPEADGTATAAYLAGFADTAARLGGVTDVTVAPGHRGGPAVPAQATAARGDGAVPGRTGGSLDDAELTAALEAILLVVDEPTGELQLAQVLQQPVERVARTLEGISARYTAAGHGFDLRRVAGGWRLYTRPEYAEYVERFVLDGQSVRLTQAALETLAVVAYKQPVTRSRISAIRGVNCDGVMRTLVTRGLIEECGTEPETGAYLYRTTALFLEKLGLNSVDQLPPLAPFLPDDVEEVLDASG